MHLIQTGQAMAGLGLQDVTSRDDAVERVASYARHHPDVQIIVGHGVGRASLAGAAASDTRADSTVQLVESRSTWPGSTFTPLWCPQPFLINFLV